MKTQTILSSLALVTATSACATGRTSAKTTEPRIISFESGPEGFNTKNYFYDNGSEVVAFDTQFTPDLAQKSIAYLRTQTQNPIKYLVITHPNPDKFNAIDEFKKEGALVVASQRTTNSLPDVHNYKKYFFVEMAKMFTNETYPKLGSVDQSFTERTELKLSNGEVIELQELKNAAVSSNQSVAFIPRLKALVVGDMIHHRAHAWLEGGIVNGKASPDLASWKLALKELRQLYPDANEVRVLGGRGEETKLDTAVTEQIRYLERAETLVSTYLKKLGSQATELNNPALAQGHYQALQKLFEKDFANYQLGYMIGYGVYGLVDAKK